MRLNNFLFSSLPGRAMINPMDTNDLTDAQREAVTYTQGPLLVIAGAGTGKTRVITHRIAYLIEEKKVSPANILALTFTNNAAEEMRERLAEMITGSFDELWLGTFHALSADILRDNALDYGISPFFRIATPGEQMLLLEGELDKLRLTYHRVKGRPYSLISTFLQTISKAKDELVGVDEYLAWAKKKRRLFESEKAGLTEKELLKRENEVGKTEEMAKVYHRYQELLAANDTMDFGQLITSCIEFFQEKPYILADYQDRWHYILVDEYQDTNLAQSRLIDLLAGDRQNICVVGDDDQSIYRFQGAAVANILEFHHRYPQTKKVLLKDNYRSTAEILAGAHSVVEKIPQRLDKRLRSATDRSNRDSLVLVEADSREAEAEFILNKINELRERDEEFQLSDVVVLAKKRSDFKDITKVFNSASVPFKQAGGGGFFNRSEIKDIIAWMQVVSNPFATDAIVRTLESEPFNLDPVECSRISQWCRGWKLPLIDGLRRTGEIKGLSPDAAAVIARWLKIFNTLASKRKKFAADLSLRRIIDKIGYRLPLIVDELLENMGKLANLNQLEHLAREFVAETDKDDLRHLLDYLKLLSAGRQDSIAEINFSADAVNLMTVHKSKGLEFKIVFLIAATDSAFPGRRRGEVKIPKELLKEPKSFTQATHEAEMRRLFYVACTRAKEELYISYPLEVTATGRPIKRSRFIDELADAIDLPLIRAEVSASSQINVGALAAARAAEAVFLKTARGNDSYINDIEDESYADIVAKELADYFNFKKSRALISATDKAAVLKKFDDIIGRLINSPYSQVVKAEQFTAVILNKASESLAESGEAASKPVSYLDFLPVNEAGGMTLSVSDIILYQKCPLAFKFKYIYQIPMVPSPEADFGIFIHNVLQRFHSAYPRSEATLEKLLSIYDKGVKVRRLGRTTAEKQLIDKGRHALQLYLPDFLAAEGEPVFFEREFNWRIKNHRIRGRVDRADKLGDGTYELIDYKSGKSWQPKQIREDLQLSIYSLAVRQSWEIEPTLLSYYFLMENKKMPALRTPEELEVAQALVLSACEDILTEKFAPKVDFINCQYCDCRVLCPATEV